MQSNTFKPPLTEVWSIIQIVLDVVGQQHNGLITNYSSR